MFGKAPIPLSDQAKTRLNAALTLVVPQKQIPPQSETVAQISQLNADIGAFMEELGQLIDSIDPDKSAAPTWFWNGRDPSKGANWDFLSHTTRNGSVMFGTGDAIQNRGAIQQLAKMLRVVNRESIVLEQISRVLVGLLGLHPGDDPEYLREKINGLRSFVQIPRQGGWCVRPYLDNFVKGSTNKEVQGTNGTETCYSAVTGAEAARKAKAWAQTQIDTLRGNKAEVSISNRMYDIFKQIKEEVNTVKILIADIRSAYAALPTLYITEQEEGVTPEFKRELAQTWLDEVEQQAEEIEMPFGG